MQTMTEARWPTREEALALVEEHVSTDSLKAHLLAVEKVMRRMARHYGEDEEKWGLAGLLHDLDFEEHPSPEEHGRAGAALIRERGWAEELARAVEAHNDISGLTRESLMEKTLYAVDELTGFVVAVSLVRPTGLEGLEPRSVRKKLKERSFAAGVDREQIARGASELGVELDWLIQRVVEGLRQS